jgi:hypothetical protein
MNSGFQDERHAETWEHSPALQEDEGLFRAADIISIVRQNLAFIALAVACSLIIATAWMKIEGPSYIARMVVGESEGLPQMNSGVSLLGSIGGGGLSSLLGSSHSPLYERFEELLTSQRVADSLQKDHRVMQHLFRKRWDPANQQWVRPSGILAWVSASLHEFFGMPAWTPPGIANLTQEIQKKLSISDTKNTNLRQIEYEDEDRQFALSMLHWLYQAADGAIRDDDIVRTRNEITYLRQELNKVTGVEHRTAIMNLLEVEERRQMLLLSNAPYGATVIVSSEAPIKPNAPKISLTYGLATLVAALISILFLSWRTAVFRRQVLQKGATFAEARAGYPPRIGIGDLAGHLKRLSFSRKSQSAGPL